MYTLKDMLKRSLILNAHGTAIVDGEDSYTWSDVVRRARAIAASLTMLGFTKGDRMAIMSLNCPRFLELQYAVLWAGGMVVPINTRFAASEIIYCLNDMDDPWICSDDAMLMRLQGIRSSLHHTKGLIYSGT